MKTALIFLLFSLSINAIAQNNFAISAGLGFPELINTGLKYSYKQVQAGIAYGAWPYEGKIFSVSGDVFLHFGNLTEFTDVRPWFGRLGVNYVKDETASAIYEYSYINTRIGRELNISEKFGITLDAGAIFQFSNKTTWKQYYFFKVDSLWDSPVAPSGSIGLFFRI